VTSVKEGDAVGIAWLHDACGACEYCITGWETLCEFQHNAGYHVNGGFAEYAIGSAAYIGKLPADADFAEIAPILCAGVTTYKALKQTEAKPGQWVAITGVGGLGHIGVQYAKAMGLHVVALDVTEDKLALARSAGAEVAVNAKDPDAVAQVVEATGGGAHGVLVTAPSPPAFAQALNIVRRKGTVALIGLPAASFPMPIIDVVLKGITVRGSIVGTRKDLSEAIQFAHEGKVRAEIKKAKLEEINEVLANLKAGKVKGRIVLDFA
jgi:propanol-preferring alcohol dehydrogenase